MEMAGRVRARREQEAMRNDVKEQVMINKQTVNKEKEINSCGHMPSLVFTHG